VNRNGNTTRFGSLAPGTEVQISQPQGLSVGLDGDIILAEAGNSMIRAYDPRSRHVSDVLGGLVSPGGVPQAGFNGDGRYGDQTKLDHPLGVAATAAGTYVVADTPKPDPGVRPQPPRRGPVTEAVKQGPFGIIVFLLSRTDSGWLPCVRILRLAMSRKRA
jgi:hypothetical protein